MTETSGEATSWLAYGSWSSFPNEGAFSIAIELHQALTAGEVTAWMYWQMADNDPVSTSNVTDGTLLNQSPKFVAPKHFYKFIRPGMKRVEVAVSGGPDLETSAYYGGFAGSTAADVSGTLMTIVMVNVAATATTFTLPADITASLLQIDSYASRATAMWQAQRLTAVRNTLTLTVPGYEGTTMALTRVNVIPEPAGLGLLFPAMRLGSRVRWR